MHPTLTLTLPLLPVLSLLFFSSSISSQATSQQQICTNACAAASACYNQCTPATTGSDPYAGTDAHVNCECQGGCLCNAEICLGCCEAAGNNAPFCGTLGQVAAGNVISYCAIVSRSLSFPAYDRPNRGVRRQMRKCDRVSCFSTDLISLFSSSSSFFSPRRER